MRDLPQGAKQIPAQYKGEPWANLGVNVDDDFTPIYIVPPGKTKQIKLLKDQLKKADALYLATDEDREGEAISWHLLELLKPKVPVHRLVFHEITKDAIQAALASPRRRRRRAGASPGNAADSRPAVRLRSVAAALAQGAAEAFGRPRAKRGRAIDRRTRAGADGVRVGHLVGFARQVRQVRAASSSTRRWSRSTAARFPPARISTPSTGKLKNPQLLLLDAETSAALAERIRTGEFRVTKVEDKPYVTQAVRAVHHQHAAAGSQPQARLHRPPDDAGRPEPVRKRPHHLHAYRLDQPGDGRDRRRRGGW